MEMMDQGPFMFASVEPSGMGRAMGASLVFSYVIQVIGAFIVAWMLSCTKGLTFWYKVRFVTIFGLGVGVLGFLPSWNWLGFPGVYVFMNMVDLVIGWFLAGMVMAQLNKSTR